MVKEFGEMFERNYAIPVHIISTDLAGLDCNLEGDILFCDNTEVLANLTNGGCVVENLPISYATPVLVLPRNKAHQFHSFDEIKSYRLSVAIPSDIPAFWNTAARFFPDQQYTIVEVDSVSDPETFLQKDENDAVMIWDYIALGHAEQLQIIPFPRHVDDTATINVVVLTTCKDVPTYKVFLEMLTSNTGKDILKKYHFPPLQH